MTEKNSDLLDVYAKIGDNIRTLRKAKKLTQFHMAEICGIEPSNLNRIENGRTNPTVRSLVLIADALGVSMKDLMKSV